GPWASTVRGLGEIELDPLALTLWHILPHAGWRLPDTRGLCIADVRVGPDALVVTYRPERAGTGELEEPPARRPDHFQLQGVLDRLREGDERLIAGDVLAAMRVYRARLAAYTDDEPLLLERMLAVGSARPELFDECAELAARALARWPDFAAAQAALASIAVARGDIHGAGARYRALSQIAGAAGEREPAVRAALAGARLLRRAAPAEATPLYERVLELDPAQPEAMEALADRYTDERRFADLVRLLRGRAAAAASVVRQARDLVRVAQILVNELGDPDAARRELDEATRLDPHSPAAHEVLADIEAAQGRPAAAAAALDRAAHLYGERRDRRGHARALLRGAALREAAGAPDRAEAAYHAVLEPTPGEPTALRGAVSAGRAGVAARGSLERARALRPGPCGPAGRGAAEGALRRAAASASPALAAEGHQLAADLARAGRGTGDAIGHLDRAVEALA